MSSVSIGVYLWLRNGSDDTSHEEEARRDRDTFVDAALTAAVQQKLQYAVV